AAATRKYLMRERSLLRSWLKDNSFSRVAEKSLTGMLIRPKAMAPDQMARAPPAAFLPLSSLGFSFSSGMANAPTRRCVYFNVRSGYWLLVIGLLPDCVSITNN